MKNVHILEQTSKQKLESNANNTKTMLAHIHCKGPPSQMRICRGVNWFCWASAR